MKGKWTRLFAVLLTGLMTLGWAGTVSGEFGPEGKGSGGENTRGEAIRDRNESCEEELEALFGVTFVGDQMQTQQRLQLDPDGEPHPDPGEYPRQEQHN